MLICLFTVSPAGVWLSEVGSCLSEVPSTAQPRPATVKCGSGHTEILGFGVTSETSVCPAVELKLNLDQYVSKRYPGLVKIVRNGRREGLIRARLQGWKAATAPVVGFFDAHVEFSTGW